MTRHASLFYVILDCQRPNCCGQTSEIFSLGIKALSTQAIRDYARVCFFSIGTNITSFTVIPTLYLTKVFFRKPDYFKFGVTGDSHFQLRPIQTSHLFRVSSAVSSSSSSSSLSAGNLSTDSSSLDPISSSHFSDTSVLLFFFVAFSPARAPFPLGFFLVPFIAKVVDTRDVVELPPLSTRDAA